MYMGGYPSTYLHPAARYEQGWAPGQGPKNGQESKGVLTVSILQNNWKYSMEHNGVKVMLMTAQ